LAFPLFLIGYATFVFFRKQYAAVILPTVFVATLLGARTVGRTFPNWRPMWTTFITLALALLAIAHLPEFNGSNKSPDQLNPTPILSAFESQVRKLPHKPAIVLVYHAPNQNIPRHEPVYNTDVPWPDDAQVIRAHDLGDARNAELFAYYAKRQPDRYVYRFDKATKKMTPLGRVADLAPSE
jgi:hypothetical protein